MNLTAFMQNNMCTNNDGFLHTNLCGIVSFLSKRQCYKSLSSDGILVKDQNKI